MAASFLDLDRMAAGAFASLVVDWAKTGGIPLEALVSRACAQSSEASTGDLAPLFMEELIDKASKNPPAPSDATVLYLAFPGVRLAVTGGGPLPPRAQRVDEATASAVVVGAARAQVQMASVQAGAELGWEEQERLIVALATHLRGHTSDSDAGELQSHTVIAARTIEDISIELHSQTLEDLAKSQAALLTGLVSSNAELRDRLAGLETRNDRAIQTMAESTRALGSSVKGIVTQLEEVDELTRWCASGHTRATRVATDWSCYAVTDDGKPAAIVSFAVGDFKPCKFTVSADQQDAIKDFANRVGDILAKNPSLHVWVRGFASTTKPFTCRETDEAKWKDWCGAFVDGGSCAEVGRTVPDPANVAKRLNAELAVQRSFEVEAQLRKALKPDVAARVKVANASVAGPDESSFTRAVLFVIQ